MSRINESCKKEIKISGNIIEKSKCVKLLGIKIDSKLVFNHKIHPLARITCAWIFQKNHILFNVFFKTEFS